MLNTSLAASQARMAADPSIATRYAGYQQNGMGKSAPPRAGQRSGGGQANAVWDKFMTRRANKAMPSGGGIPAMEGMQSLNTGKGGQAPLDFAMGGRPNTFTDNGLLANQFIQQGMPAMDPLMGLGTQPIIPNGGLNKYMSKAPNSYFIGSNL